MAHLTPPPVTDADAPPDPSPAARPGRFGLALFALYAALYGVFVLLTAFAPAALAAVGPGGINIAVLYGFGLILSAVVLAVVYVRFAAPAADGEGRP